MPHRLPSSRRLSLPSPLALRCLPAMASLLVAASVAAPAAAQTPAACLSPGAVVTAAELKFSAAAPGNVVATGNTLGLSKASGVNGPGTSDSIGTFIALDAGGTDSSPAPGWFAGTTSDWTQNGSSAVLQLPNEVEILHAELVWGGSYADPDGAGSLAGSLGTSVTLASDGADTQVSPDATGIDVSEGTLFRYYARSADVTAFVAAHGEGTFTVSGVPGKQSEGINSLHTAGWTLMVAYRDQAQPIRNLTIYFGGEFVDEGTTQDYGFADFCASSAGDLDGTAIITALEGDANRSGDVLCIAPSENPQNDDFVGLSGPNSSANNFFASQINGPDGDLDTSGTFGDRNHDAFAPVDNVTAQTSSTANTSGGRQGWDITQIALSSDDGSLAPAQTGARLRTATASDSYLPMAAAFSIVVNAPSFSTAESATEITTDEVAIGDSFTVTAHLSNSGPVAAEGILLAMPVPAGLTLDGFTTDGMNGDVDGDVVVAGDLTSGVDQGTLDPGEERIVTATFTVDAAPSSGSRFNLRPRWSYEWEMCLGEAPLSETFAAPIVFADYVDEGTSAAGTGGAGPGGAGPGAGGGAPGTGGSSGSAGGDDPSSSGSTSATGSATTTAASGSTGAGTPSGAGVGGSAADGDDDDGEDGDGGSDGEDEGTATVGAEGCDCGVVRGSGSGASSLAAALILAAAAARRRQRAR